MKEGITSNRFQQDIRRIVEKLDEPLSLGLQTGGSCIIHVQDWADEEILEALFIADPSELMGIYSGIARSIDLHMPDPNAPVEVWLFAEAIRANLQPEQSLEELVAQVVSNEIGAHFRWDETRILSFKSKLLSQI